MNRHLLNVPNIYVDGIVEERDYPNYSNRNRYFTPKLVLVVAIFATLAVFGFFVKYAKFTNDAIPYCQSGWVFYEPTNRCYKVVEKAVTWTLAQQECSNEAADLVTIHSKQEAEFISALAPDHAWIGLRKRHPEAGYTWVDGTEVDFENWAQGAPRTRQGWDEFCAETGSPRSTDLKNQNRWSNVDCNTIFVSAFICQRPIEQGASMKPAAAQLCPDGYSLLTSSVACFKVYATRSNWRDAESECSRDGGHLASVHSAVENDFITSLSARALYIGLHPASASSWKWTDETEVDFENINRVESTVKTEEPRNCFIVEGASSGGGEGGGSAASKWRNVACGLPESFVCRQPARLREQARSSEESIREIGPVRRLLFKPKLIETRATLEEEKSQEIHLRTERTADEPLESRNSQ